MASSSNSFPALALVTLLKKRNNYDVFVTFRGEDTRYNFTDYLFNALEDKGVSVFRDDTNLPKGDTIGPELLRAIEDSQVFVVIFSKNYASSTWCLQELEKICECVQVSGKHVLPVFYDVDPSEVRKQSGIYGEAFVKHEQRFQQDYEISMVQRWRKALTQVGTISGWDVRHKPQSAQIKEIVQRIMNILDCKPSCASKDLVGMDSPIQELQSHLFLNSVDDVRTIGICGIGGIGKTTLATAMYDRVSNQFDACCFIDDVSKVYRSDDGPLGVQKQILHKTLGKEHKQIWNNHEAINLMQRRLGRVRTLLILDNVDHVKQLEIIPVNREWLGAGSRIIIISRDEHILKKYGVDVVYKVSLLNFTNSLELFCRQAFKHDHILNSYEGLVSSILHYANGLPLAIEVLGSSLYGRNISEWRSALYRLRELLSRLRELEKCLLLHSVNDVRAVGICGMDGTGKTTLATILYEKISQQFDACCFMVDVSKTYEQYGPIGVQKEILRQTLGKEYILFDETDSVQSRLCKFRALIILDNVDLSDQLEKLAVTRKSLAPGSKIIIVCRDVHILKEYGVDAVYQVPSATEVLDSSLSGQSVSESKFELNKLGESPDEDIMDTLQFSFNVLEEREKEIFLHIACFFNQCEKDYVQNVLNCCGFNADFGLDYLIDKSFISISDESKIVMHALLEELGRKIVHEKSRKWSKLWLHEQFYNVVLENMENNVDAVVLYGSEREKGKLMAEALSKMNCLRLLILKGVKFSGSLEYLSNELRYVEWDEYPFLYLPSSFQPNPLVELILVDSSIKQLWIDTKNLPNLRILDLSHSENLTKMPDFREFPNLKKLNLEGCVKLVQIDSSIGLLRELVFLNLKNCENLICIPNEISGLTALKYLNLCGCSKAFNNPKAREDFSSCVLPSLPSFSCLSELDISFCRLSQIPDALGCLTWLERLNLRGNNFVILPSLQDLSKLEYLNLEHCKQLTSLPELPSPAAIKKDKLKRVGMYIFNCPELGEREHCTSMAFSWITNFIQANQNSSASFHQIDIVIPGSEIPSWFNSWKMGRSISIDPSPIVYDDNIIGIACCAVFSVQPFDPTKTRYEWGPVVRLGFKSSNAANSNYVVIPVTLYRHLVTVKSNHMWLIFFDRELFFSFLRSIDNTLWELDHIVMEASVTNGQGLHLEVKNCGYSWVFKQDQQPSESLNKDVLQNEETLVLQSTTHMVIEDEAQPQ